MSELPRAGSLSQAFRTAAVCLPNGVQRSLRPLPWQRTCARAQRKVSPTQACHLGHPQAGLESRQQEGVVAPSTPGLLIGRGQESLDLGRVRKPTRGRACRLLGMASTR